MKKLGAVVTLAKPQNAEQVKNLVENLDLFDFAPGAHSPAAVSYTHLDVYKRQRHIKPQTIE